MQYRVLSLRSSFLIASFAVAATTLAVLAIPSYAQPASPDAMPPAAPTTMHHAMPTPELMSAIAQKRLDKMEKKLNLQASQQAAWASYKSATLAQAAERATKMQQQREAMQQKLSGAGKEITAPERMEQHAQRMREQADAMSRHAQQAQALYQVLSPEQRTIFDLMTTHHGKLHGMGHHLAAPVR